MESLADCFDELGADLAIVTETWLQDKNVAEHTIDAAGEHGLSSFLLNRDNIAVNGRQYGGVAIFSKAASSKLSKFELPNPEHFEILAVAGKLGGIREKVVAIAVYIPPNYTRVRAEACLDYVSDVIAESKRLYDSPLIVVGGDWNQWPMQLANADHRGGAWPDEGN